MCVCGVCVQDEARGLAYISHGRQALAVVDVSVPRAPVLLAALNAKSGIAKTVTLCSAREPPLAFVAETFNGVRIVNTSLPADPQTLLFSQNSWGKSDYAMDMAVTRDGEFMFVADRDSVGLSMLVCMCRLCACV
jgi:hypothetical protein